MYILHVFGILENEVYNMEYRMEVFRTAKGNVLLYFFFFKCEKVAFMELQNVCIIKEHK